jgi:hypothetical protein
MGILFVCFTLVFAFVMNIANAQERNPVDYLDQLPEGLKLDPAVMRSYRMTTDYWDFDLHGNFAGKRD